MDISKLITGPYAAILGGGFFFLMTGSVAAGLATGAFFGIAVAILVDKSEDKWRDKRAHRARNNETFNRFEEQRQKEVQDELDRAGVKLPRLVKD